MVNGVRSCSISADSSAAACVPTPSIIAAKMTPIPKILTHIQDTVPTFRIREMVVLSILFFTAGYFFMQSFKVHNAPYEQVLDDIYDLSNLHSELDLPPIK